jgi:hypothetical protein
LAGFDDDLFFFWAVSVGAWVFTVLFLAGFATEALSAIWGETVFDEVFTLAVWAGKGDGDRQKSFYIQPLPDVFKDLTIMDVCLL